MNSLILFLVLVLFCVAVFILKKHAYQKSLNNKKKECGDRGVLKQVK